MKSGILAVIGLIVGIAIGALLGGGHLATPTTFTTTVVQTSTQYTDAESLNLRSTVG